MARSNFVNEAFLLEKVKKVDFSKIIAACDLKLIELMKVLTFVKGHLYMKIKLAVRNHLAIFNQILNVSL